MSTATHDSEWIDARAAAKILGVPGARNVHRLVSQGLIKTRDLPGVRARYSRADVDGLAGRGRDAERPGWRFNYLYDVLPDARNDGGLVGDLTRYKTARDRFRAGACSAPGDEPLFGTPFQLVTTLGDLVLRELNRAIDQDWDALIAAVTGPTEDQGIEPTDRTRRLWEILARSAASRAADESSGTGARA